MSPPDDAVMLRDDLAEGEAATGSSSSRPIRFTSNIVGPIFLAADLFCLFASIPVALFEAEAEGRLKPGDMVMTVGFGAGLVWGANLIRW